MLMPSKKLILITGCVFPLLVHAEVLDKMAQPLDMWLHALLGIVLAFVSLRIHWAVFLAAMGYPALWFSALLMDLHSFDLGPAIAAEAEAMYSFHAHAAAAVWVIGIVTLLVHKRITTSQLHINPISP